MLEENMSLYLLTLETIMSSAEMVILLEHQISLRCAARSSSVTSGTGQLRSQPFKFYHLFHFEECSVEDFPRQFSLF